MDESLIVKRAVMSSSWWVQLIRGLLAILFGIIAISWPGITLEILVILFGIYVFLFSILAVIFAVFTKEGHKHWWPLLIEALVGIVVGFIVLANPSFAFRVGILIIGVWAIITGIAELILSGEDLLFLVIGLISILFGIILLIWSGIATLLLILLIGFYSIVFGIVLCVLSFQIRRFQKEIQE
jgi:uncharacterized membrane protein HdeD (DUF308 family)